jgi:thiosulfate reductase cytochrome b subunit
VLPVIAQPLGGLQTLAPIHAVIAWLFAAFILVHVYMTTTGATPVEATKAMITGYEDVEVHEHVEDEKKEGESE